MSGPKLEKRMILGSSKLTRNPISTSWYFCSTDWWTSEFRHFRIWNYQKLNKRSYYTFKNNYDSHDTLPHLYILLDLTQTKTTLKYGSMYIWNLLGNITIWKHYFSLETNVYNIGKIQFFETWNIESGPKWTVQKGESERSLKWTVARKWTVLRQTGRLFEPK